MKKEVKAIICVVLAVWFFFMGFEIGSYKEKKAISTNAPTHDQSTTASAQTTSANETQASTEAFTTAENTTMSSIETTAAANEEPTANEEPSSNNDPSSLSKEEVIEKASAAINAVKAQQDFTGKKAEIITINVTECSIQRAVSFINKVISGIADDENYTYAFSGGQAQGVDENGKDVEGVVSPNEVIPPKNAQSYIDPAGVLSAKAEKEGDNTVYKIVLVEENTTYTEPVPQYNSTAFSHLDLTAVDLKGATVTDASMHYPATEITVTVDPDGRIVKLHYYMPMDGYGQAKVIGLSASASFEGSDDETWEFTY